MSDNTKRKNRVSQYNSLAKFIEKKLEEKGEVTLKITRADVTEFLKKCSATTTARDVIRRACDCTKFRAEYRSRFFKDSKSVSVFLPNFVKADAEQPAPAVAQTNTPTPPSDAPLLTYKVDDPIPTIDPSEAYQN